MPSACRSVRSLFSEWQLREEKSMRFQSRNHGMMLSPESWVILYVARVENSKAFSLKARTDTFHPHQICQPAAEQRISGASNVYRATTEGMRACNALCHPPLPPPKTYSGVFIYRVAVPPAIEREASLSQVSRTDENYTHRVAKILAMSVGRTSTFVARKTPLTRPSAGPPANPPGSSRKGTEVRGNRRSSLFHGLLLL